MKRIIRMMSMHLAVWALPTASAILIFSAFPVTAFADPPATVASCEGIGSAYSILGTQCSNAYAKINHAPANAEERLSTFRARIDVLEIFRKALLCNGMYGAGQAAQDRFRAQERGHLTALQELHTSMEKAGDPDLPPAYTAQDLNATSIKKAQCK